MNSKGDVLVYFDLKQFQITDKVASSLTENGFISNISKFAGKTWSCCLNVHEH